MTLLAVLAGIIVLLGGAGYLAPALLIDRHDGDVMHLLDMVFRMVRGQMPHLDFVTPLGVLSIWPISVFVKLGFGAGHALILAQIALALVLLLPVWWVAWTRLPGIWAHVFGASVLILCLAMIYGGADTYLSMSMHYNRWAWALAFLVLAIGYLPPIGASVLMVDALILGLAMAALTLLKVTFMVALAPPVIVMMLLRRDHVRLLAAIVIAAAALGLSLAVLGGEFWIAYAEDLLSTARSDLRDYPGLPPIDLASAPAYVVGSLLTLAAVMFLRTGGRPNEGLGLLVLLPAVIYITAQNFGNDPKWLWIVGLIVLALRPGGGRRSLGGADSRTALGVIGAGLLISVAPSFINMAASPIRNLAEDQSDYIAMLPGDPANSDYRVLGTQALRYDISMPGDLEGSGMEWAREGADREAPPEFLGEVLEECRLSSGFLAWARSIARDLAAAGYAEGQQILNADLLNIYWLLAPGIPPLQGGAPWLYEGLPGWEATEFVLVPRCPLQPSVRSHYLQEISKRIDAGEVVLEEVRRTPLYTLYSKRDL